MASLAYLAPDIRAEAQSLIGIPFVVAGRDFRAEVGGTDCLGLVLEFLHRIGIAARDPWEVVAERWQADDALRAGDLMPSGWRPVEGGDLLQVGDVGESLGGRHLSVFVGGGYTLHARRNTTSFLRPAGTAHVARWWRWHA